tara:strand:- start:1855 stop:2694 length:840 start_codon:yes stop_codon:yes gene_type:complete
MKNFFIERLLISLIGIPLLLYIIAKGGFLFFALVVIISIVSMNEFYNFPKSSIDIKTRFFGAISCILFALNYSTVYTPTEYLPYINKDLIIISLIIAFILYIMIELLIPNRRLIETIFYTVFGVIYIPFLLCSLIAISDFDQLNGSRFTLLLFVTVWMADSAAYFVGNAFGRTKMIESISPKKTIEGFIGGYIGSLLCVFIFTYFELLKFSLTTLQIILLSISIGIFGQLGDFFESMIKRNYKIKDSSNLLLGHGGFLDRFDSIIISSPLIFIFLRFIS